MVDWDDIRLSDPMQDIGLLLWWYVAREYWPAFFQNYGLPIMNNSRIEYSGGPHEALLPLPSGMSHIITIAPRS